MFLSVSRIRSEIPGLPTQQGPKNRFVHEFRYDKSTQQVSIIDVIRLITGKQSNHAGEALKYIKKTYPEVVENIDHLQFSGPGQRKTPVCDANTMNRIIMKLQGRAADEICIKFSNLVCRYMAGDLSMAAEIVYRNSTVSDVEEKLWSKDIDRTHYITKRKRDIALLEIETQQLNAKRLRMHRETLLEFSPNKVLDQRDIMNLKDMSRNILMMKIDQSSSSDREISIPLVVLEKGYPALTHGQSIKIGTKIAKKYRQRHNGQNPTKKDQQVLGTIVKVNAYWQKDYDLIERSIEEVLNL